MEVASPLSFGHTPAGSKRQFPCTPVTFDTTNRSPFGDSADDFLHQRFKRRRFAVDESMDGDNENTVNQSPFINNQAFPKPFLSSSSGKLTQVPHLHSATVLVIFVPGDVAAVSAVFVFRTNPVFGT